MRKRKYFATQNILLLLQFPVDISYSKLKFRTRNLHFLDKGYKMGLWCNLKTYPI